MIYFFALQVNSVIEIISITTAYNTIMQTQNFNNILDNYSPSFFINPNPSKFRTRIFRQGILHVANNNFIKPKQAPKIPQHLTGDQHPAPLCTEVREVLAKGKQTFLCTIHQFCFRCDLVVSLQLSAL